MNVEQALEQLKNDGFKYTGKREQMLELFSKEKRYLSAKDVLVELQKDYPGVSFDTVYRNLSLFAEKEILEMTELDGEKKFRFSCATSQHHHHLICLDCGKTKHIHSCPMDWLEENVESDFAVTSHKFEIYGYCEECQAKSKVTA
ncbi:Fur family transcriptional regulator [Sinobaca sp. H24]|uniref:Fur family transcriptional regulator n=1 Tax=Sinobaca sp. H24 TaxID=2923376 RepID=UPI00207AB76B|nr:Fur family transcriptional regulator [Sinobaca sp. H24]